VSSPGLTESISRPNDEVAPNSELETEMTLIKRMRPDMEWPEFRQWPMLSSRWLSEWPDSMREMLDHSHIKVEEFQDNGHLVVRAELPGIDPDKDVEITISDHVLSVRAQRSSEKSTEDTKGYRSEFNYGSFSRSVSLPAGTTEDKVKATYSDGILEVRIPINDTEAKAQRIPIARS
jgi:HSP20 family protein